MYICFINNFIAIFAICILVSISLVSAKEYDPEFEYAITVETEGSLGLELEKGIYCL